MRVLIILAYVIRLQHRQFNVLKGVAISLISALALAACGSSISPLNMDVGSGSGSDTTSSGVIRVLSNRSDLISGGDALIELVVPSATNLSAVKVISNQRDVSSAFSRDASGRVLGLITGLVIGKNSLTAEVGGGPISTVTIINHPNSGPIFAGPQLHPWTCLNAAAVDAQCNQPPEYTFLYKSTAQPTLQAYDPTNPPNDVENTTTDQGVTVPFIVRVETGYQDRDQYKIAVLFQPGQPWVNGTKSQPQFNHKLLINHGGSCGVEYQTGSAPDVVGGGGGLVGAPDSLPAQYALSKGFVVMSTALNASAHNCNVALQAESMVMAKERVIEQYGTLRYTIGEGCSGGSLAAQWVANAYPGIYDGILPTCSFPDTWSSATQFVDTHLLDAYFTDPTKWGAAVVWSPTQMADVLGHLTIVNGEVGEVLQFDVVKPGTQKGPLTPCGGISAAQVYDAQSNPGGVRCSIQDAAINQFGPQPPELWTDNEKKAGRGFVKFPIDNVGVQYGLAVLRAGTITPGQFIDLNAKVGGLDIDANIISQRTVASGPSLANAYRTGLINTTSNLDRIALIDCRGPDPGAFHDAYRTYAIRARLDQEHGNHNNELIWEGPVALQGDVYCDRNSLIAMDRWLAAVEKDISATPLTQKLTNDRPSDIGDRCYDGVGNKVSDGRCPAGVVPYYGTPRTVAGDAITTETNKCQLRPLNRMDDYGPLEFSDQQWTQMQALFPLGVCDFTKPGVSQQKTIPWMTYQDSNGNVIYGGTPLPLVPSGSVEGWSSPAFRNY